MSPLSARLSLTLRLALLYAGSTLAVVVAVAVYMLHMVDGHFVEEDVAEMHGKLELSSRLLAKAQAEGSLDTLPWQLDDALVGHHHLTLAIHRGGTRWYANGSATLPPGLLAATATEPHQARLVEWREGAAHYRGLALAAAAPPGHVIAVAVETGHHGEFLAALRLALAGVVAVAGLAAALLGWAVARAGLAPLRQLARHAGSITADRLAERLKMDAVPPELRELASAFNAMLDRLGDSFQRLSDFSADLAHEMRTPVSNLMTQTQVTLSQTRGAEEYREVLASNLEEYERLARMIADMLFLAKADQGLIVPTRETAAQLPLLDQRIQRRNHRQRQHGRRHHAAHHRRGDAAHDLAAGAGAPHDRQQAGHDRHHGHHLRAHALDRAFHDRLVQVGDAGLAALGDWQRACTSRQAWSR
jgi:two-component system heavy metal sensor histidine kinase CusS